MQGVYALEIVLNKDLQIKVGALGTKSLPADGYVYIGSAQKGLDNRIKRHLKNYKKRFWHIDYMLTFGCAQATRVLYKQGPKELECETAANLLCYGTPVLGFGSSDCRCKSHLIRISDCKVANILSDWIIYH